MFRTYRVTGRQVVYHPDVAPTIVPIARMVRAESDEDAEGQALFELLQNPWCDVLELRAVAG